MSCEEQLPDMYTQRTYKVALEVVDPDTDEALDLTGCTITFIMKSDVDQLDVDAAVEVDAVIDPDQVTNKGKALLLVGMLSTDLEPGRYYYDLTLIEVSGESQPLLTPRALSVIQSVLRDA